MGDKILNVVYIVIGALAGVALGFIIISQKSISTTLVSYQDIYFLSLLGLIGALIAGILVLAEREHLEQESEKLRNETIALITHEMRTSLTSNSWVISYILTNYKEILKPDDKKTLEDIVKSIHTTVMHTINLLDVSLLDIGKLSISLEWLTLEKIEEMFKEIMEKYDMGARRDNVKLTMNLNLDHSKKVEVDRLRLRIILENLLENSMQYTRVDPKMITVNISNTANQLLINVEDNGIGIPFAEQSQIFKEFYRATNARVKLTSGSGIGLHMCAQYVKAHHGTIRFESTEGKGTTFFISLPLKTQADTTEFLNKI